MFSNIILVDDFSSDKTFVLAKKIGWLETYRNQINLGYGGNLKRCLDLAFSRGADVIVELSPDGEYKTTSLKEAILKARNGTDLILGNRFLPPNKVLQSGMFFWKYVFLAVLNKFHNFVLRTSRVDYHQGFRVYTKKLLELINLKNTGNGYIFSFELILKAVFLRAKIDTVSVETRYRGKKRGAGFINCLIYGLETFRVLGHYFLAKRGFFQEFFHPGQKNLRCPFCRSLNFYRETSRFKKNSLYFCRYCKIGSAKKTLNYSAKSYPGDYWGPKGIVGFVKENVFRVFQKRRIRFVKSFLSSGSLLDVGCGRGIFLEQAKNSFSVFGLEHKMAKVKNDKIIKDDYLTYDFKKRFDAVSFWESLEHMDDPSRYLLKTRKILKKNGLVFIEYPRFGCFESKFFSIFWFHLDLPRHRVHFTDDGIKLLLKNCGFKILKQKGVFSMEYAPWGFLVSVVNLILHKTHRFNAGPVFLFLPFLPAAVLFELTLFIFGQSPIGVIAGQKES